MAVDVQNTAIILMNPQMGENIGAAARIMKNFSYHDLRVINPKCGWPSEKAEAMSAGAKDVVENARLCNSLEEALEDIDYVFAATVRKRDMIKPAINSTDLSNHYPQDRKVAILFGGERCGLSNSELSIADKIVTIVSNEECSSLNLAQSVAVLCYELQRESVQGIELGDKIDVAPKAEMLGMLKHLEQELDRINFYREHNKRDSMLDNITNMFTRTGWTDQEIRTFRGIIRSLSQY